MSSLITSSYLVVAQLLNILMQGISNKYKSFIQYLTQLITYQLSRWSFKGYGIIISLITFTSYFTILPDLLAYIWPYVQDTMSQTNLFILVLGGINVVVVIVYTTVMYVIYTGKFEFLEQYRISKEPWPWESNYQEWKKLMLRSVKSIVTNSLFWAPLIVWIDCQISFKVKMRLEDVPESKMTYFWQFIFFLIVEQIWNYLMHALLHQPAFYWIHKPHHEYTIPVSIAGQHIHPIEYILSSSISTGLGYKILTAFTPVHIFSLIIWIIFRVIQTNDSHAGYNWPWIQSALIPGNSGDNYHYFHHKLNVGNYAGIMYFMDSLFGSNKQFWAYGQEIKKEQDGYLHPHKKQ